MVFTLKDANADFKNRSGDVFGSLIHDKLPKPSTNLCQSANFELPEPIRQRSQDELSTPSSFSIKADVAFRSSGLAGGNIKEKSSKSSANSINDDDKFKVPAPVSRRPVNSYSSRRTHNGSPTPRCPYKNFKKYSLACVDSVKLYTGLRGDSLNNKVAADFLATLRARKSEEQSLESVRKTANTKRSRTSNGKITLPEYDFCSSKAGMKSKCVKLSNNDVMNNLDADAVSAKMSNAHVSLSHLQNDSEDEDVCM